MRVFTAFASLFPPPSYMALPSIGLDISDTSLKYVSFVPSMRTKNIRILDKWGDISIPDNVLQNGEINDVKILTDVLKEFKIKTGAEYVRVSLPEERAYIFETKIKKNVPLKEIHSLLEFRLEENVPISARDALFDYQMLSSDSKSNEVQVVVAAYQKETVLKYYDVCRAAGLTPLSFEVESQAMARAVVPAQFKDTVMLLDFGRSRTGVGIVQNGDLLYTSTIDIGGRHLSQVLRKVVGDLAESELTNIKNTSGLIRGVEDARVYEALISTVSVIKDEIASRMQYWHLKDDNRNNRRIKKIILCGGSVNLKGLLEYLTESLGMPCEKADVWVNAFQT